MDTNTESVHPARVEIHGTDVIGEADRKGKPAVQDQALSSCRARGRGDSGLAEGGTATTCRYQDGGTGHDGQIACASVTAARPVWQTSLCSVT
jgi:hypothetical protein